MIRKELAKDPKLANESWDRFLPQFRKRHLKTSEKTAKKNEKLQAKAEASGLVANAEGAKKETRKERDKKKVYTPFPPAQQPRKVCSAPLILLFLKQSSISTKPLVHPSRVNFYITLSSDRSSTGNWRVFPESTRKRSTRNTAAEATGQIISTLLAPHKPYLFCS